MSDRSAYPLLSVEEAQHRVLDTIHVLEAETAPVLDALGRVLAEDVSADRDVPPLDNSAMDGYAVRFEDIAAALPETPVRLRVIGELPAGQMPETVVGPGQAVRIMTGAPMPPGADTVARFERTVLGEGWVDVLAASRQGRNVRSAGEDVRQGQIVLQKGSPVRPQEVGMLASVGRKDVSVIRRPRVAILATGDEVVDVDAPLGPGQIRNINGYSNAAQVHKYGGVPLALGIARDRADELSAKLRQGLESRVDLFVTSGGVSAGDFDLVKDVLAAEGRIDFWWVNMKPGKPMAFGTIDHVPLLALPGNPVAAMISFELFARPMIRKMLGYRQWAWDEVPARLREGIERKDGRRHYLRVRLTETERGLEAVLTGDQGSGILSSMVRADGLAVIPEDAEYLPEGSMVRVLLLD